jgi:hypothetical protein
VSKRGLVPLALALAAVATRAHAHGTRVMLSTPFSPPAGFQWVAWIAGPLLVTLTVILVRRLSAATWRKACLAGTSAVILAATAFFYFGRVAGNSSTAPPPGLGWGASVHWGLGWASVGEDFVAWNAIGLVFLGTALGILCMAFGVRSRRKILALYGIEFSMYVLCLVPYLCSGALSHGWPGNYTHDYCRTKLSRLGMEVLKYARAHRRLPEAEWVSALLREHDRWGEPRGVCPVGRLRTRQPESYRWNAELSGTPLDEVGRLTEPEILLSCPHHPIHERWYPKYYALYTWDIMNPEREGNAEYVSLRTCGKIHTEQYLKKAADK